MTLRSPNQPPFPRLFTYRSNSADGAERRWPNLPPVGLGWRLFGLVLLCLIPRAWVAYLVEPICHDGYYYITIASAFQHGEWADAFAYLNLNIYPVILLGLNSLGMEWVLAGKFWSVLTATLAVLPLFGWIRRMFSDQVAWASCFLYSLHAEFLERSFEPMRDPTFWFLFNLCLYTTVRAVSEVRYRWFIANGIVLTIAIHTRSEGWLLTIPLLLWVARQFVVRIDCRPRLVAGTGLCLAVLPLMIVLVNLTVLSDQPEWHYGRLSHFAVGWKWIQHNLTPGEVEAVPASETNTASTPAAALVQNGSAAGTAAVHESSRVRTYFKKMASALEQINLGLLAFGLCWMGRDLFRWDQMTLFVLAFALAGAVWIIFDHHGLMNGRYFLPIYLTLMPYYGIGLLLVFQALWNMAERLSWTWLKPQFTAVFLVVLALGLGWADALTTNHKFRTLEYEFGAWLQEQHGPFGTVTADHESIRAAYRAQQGVPNMLHNWSTLPTQYPNSRPDLVILASKTTPPEIRPRVNAFALEMGLLPLSIPSESEFRGQYLVFIRPRNTKGPIEATAQSPRHTSRE